jgi:methyl-accepting chemotaxis protein
MTAIISISISLCFSLFSKCPQAKVLFGFTIDIDPHSPELLKSKRFLAHAAYMIQMLDTALNMIGPDLEMLTEIMHELGTKHIRYGVKPEMFICMGHCLITVLEDTLGDAKFNDTMKAAWRVTYGALSQDMIKAQQQKAIT